VQSYTVTADYFKTLGLRMVQGREFTAAEEAALGGTTPVIVDVTLAERLFANENPVGQLLQYGADSGTADSRPMVIVGLAPAVKHGLLTNRPEGHIYVPSGAADWTRMFAAALFLTNSCTLSGGDGDCRHDGLTLNDGVIIRGAFSTCCKALPNMGRAFQFVDRSSRRRNPELKFCSGR
jgi:hypothetical protein